MFENNTSLGELLKCLVMAGNVSTIRRSCVTQHRLPVGELDRKRMANEPENHLPHLSFFGFVRRLSFGGAKINNMTT